MQPVSDITPPETNSPVLSIGLTQFLSAATTVCATAMIALQIIIVTRQSRAGYSYSKVIEILVQSVALESLVLIVNSICAVATYVLLESNSADATLEITSMQIFAYASACRILVMVCITL
jgi:hypothetical protein